MAKTDVTNDLGIEFVPAESVPDAPRSMERDDARWVIVKEILSTQPGAFVRAKVYDKPGSAGAKASAVNSGRNKQFPAAEYEARSEKTYTGEGDAKQETGSILYIAQRA